MYKFKFLAKLNVKIYFAKGVNVFAMYIKFDGNCSQSMIFFIKRLPKAAGLENIKEKGKKY